PQRLTQQLEFIVEIDKIKGIIRQSKLFDGSRFENDAEHSWSICIMAILLKEYANFPVDLEKVIKMLLIHDIVEIDAGDVFLYDAARMDVNLKEEAAAQRIFGLLSPDQRDEYIALWREFESRTTPEAKFAAVFDRLEPLLQNYLNNGYTWKKYGIACETVVEKNRHIREGSEALWDLVQHILQHSVELGYFVPD
ncbi:MAG: HD domain-containing protein, partial [Spirochaeta sp.]